MSQASRDFLISGLTSVPDPLNTDLRIAGINLKLKKLGKEEVPQRIELLQLRAAKLMDGNRLAEAQADYAQIIELAELLDEPAAEQAAIAACIAATASMIEVKRRQFEMEEALSLAEMGAKKWPFFYKFWEHRVMILSLMGQDKKALEVAQAATEACLGEEDKAEAFFLVAVAAKNLRKRKVAAASARRTLELRPNHPQVQIIEDFIRACA